MIRWQVNAVRCALLFGLVGVVMIPSARAQEKRGLVVVISGMGSDASEAQIQRTAKFRRGNSGGYELMIDFKDAGFETKFFNWNGVEAGKFKTEQGKGPKPIVDFIRESVDRSKPKRLILVGHSWGGHTMLEVAKQLENEPKVKVEMAFSIDASSFSRGRIDPLPENIEQLVSYYSANLICWGEWKEPRVKNIFLGDPANGFMKNGSPKYDLKFDTGAHNAAEWDEKIHADIIRRATTAKPK